MVIKIAPSILSADFSKLGKQVEMLDEGGADYIHIDIMDGHFVPNLTFGPLVVRAIRGRTKLPFDVHLMMTNPMDYIDEFVDAGADIITVHAEVLPHLHRAIQQIKQKGVKAAVSLNPSTPLSVLDYVLEDLDMVLLMTVNPGFGGQEFIPAMIDKIKELRKKIDALNLDVDIQVDGGISLDNIREVAQVGANIFVAGSAVFSAPDPKQMIQDMKKEVMAL
ncbi:MAG: ribulose-phosphate 3-epimerase [Caldicoprobacterales bacterium]|jgi:ribulose-phosphate 3-epimerase|nr:ribulose-phosphate 3-epimerase [Clostridiales bacterium]